MQLVIPALFQTNPLLDNMGEARLLTLDSLLARGRMISALPAQPTNWLCQKLGILRQQDLPIAPIFLAVDGIDPGPHNWLRADPVHVRIARDQLILSEIPDLSHDEAAQLCTALVAHFGDALSPIITRSGAWIVQAHSHTRISTTALPDAIGKHIDPLLPQGADAMHWRKLLNEIQMLLFVHPVNQAREAAGLPTANSLWLWGGGTLPVMPNAATQAAIMTSQPLAQILAQFAGAVVTPMQTAWTANQAADIILLDQPHTELLRGDYTAWLDAIHTLEQHWLHPLYRSRQRFELFDPIAGKTLAWKPADRWKFWRRPQKTRRQTFTLDAPSTTSPSVTNVDEFGNRF